MKTLCQDGKGDRLDEIKGRLDSAEEHVSELEDMAIETAQTEIENIGNK